MSIFQDPGLQKLVFAIQLCLSDLGVRYLLSFSGSELPICKVGLVITALLTSVGEASLRLWLERVLSPNSEAISFLSLLPPPEGRNLREGKPLPELYACLLSSSAFSVLPCAAHIPDCQHQILARQPVMQDSLVCRRWKIGPWSGKQRGTMPCDPYYRGQAALRREEAGAVVSWRSGPLSWVFKDR